MPVVEIVTGVGAGVERAARDVAIGVGIAVREEHSTSAADRHSKAMVVESASTLHQAVEQRVLTSDVTLVLYDKSGIGCSPGSITAQQFAAHHCRPALIVNIGDYMSLDRAVVWLASFPAHLSLHVCGPDTKEAPGIYEPAYYFLEDLLARCGPISGRSGNRWHR